MTNEERQSIRKAIDETADLRTLLHLGSMAADALPGEDQNAFIKIYSLAWEHNENCRKLLYGSLGETAPDRTET